MKTMRFSLYALLLGVVLYSCRKEDTVTEQPKPGGNGDTTATDSSVNESTLLALVNNVRKTGCTCGSTAMPAVAPVTWNNLLEKAALLHSADMNKNNYFSHTGLDGSSPGTRLTRVGYNWIAYGENIAKEYTSEQAVMTDWLKSEGHCKNIMSSNVKEMGVGRDGNYWSQLFGARN
ncbi:CAP domain-containing protein [Niastella caeni]|uniref:CAP domain-containing protein n=1 Tax=Niastella caeni TaxID=2569763 RepID=A0A4S8HWA1_9BACT|nr:CAP domain-containing protein [Niastella caeni]THU39910.1 CAP domain-containing protein [Niastella caeni]